jgi:hypothetical protein
MNSEEKYRLNLKLADEHLERTLGWQILDPEDKDHGGFKNPETLRVEQGRAASVLGLCTSAYLHPDSRFYRDTGILDRMRLMSTYLSKIQHPDGSIDLHVSNVRSAPDAAFVVRPLCKAYRALKESDEESFQDVLESIGAFLRKASICLAYGEMHTPNHRWVAVAAMGDINSIFPDDILRVASEDYLSDGIDVNGDGMYIYERSNSIYTWISNGALLDISHSWNRSDLIDYVRKSLDFIVYNVHPNGEVVDEYSRRQDRSTHRQLSSSAFNVYRKMAVRDNNGLYASMADQAFRIQIDNGVAPAGYISRTDFMEFEAIPRSSLPTDYEKFFPMSKIVRIRRGKLSATIMADNFDNFFTVRNGETIIDGLKVRYNYWGWRYFNPPRIWFIKKSYVLQDTFYGVVMHPGPRETHLRTDFRITITIRELPDGFTVNIDTHGDENVVMEADFCLRPEGIISLGEKAYDLGKVNKIFFEAERAVIENPSKGKDRMEIKGGLVQHKVSNGWRGLNPWDRYGKPTTSLLITPITPYHGEIRIRTT